jgi:hypothetical protein
VKKQADSNRVQRFLLELVGIHSAIKQSRVWIDEAQTYFCAQGRTSIPFGLIQDVATDRIPDAKRTQRLRDMVQDYRDLSLSSETRISLPRWSNTTKSEDKIWYSETVSSLQNLLLWQKEVLEIELTKG